MTRSRSGEVEAGKSRHGSTAIDMNRGLDSFIPLQEALLAL